VSGPPSGTVRARVQWTDTDASGHYHFSTVLRWAEAAEAELFAQLGLVSLLGVVPRAHIEVDYLVPVWMQDEVETTIVIAEIGRASLRLAFHVEHGRDTVARGSVTAVHVDHAGGRATPWPDELRRQLEGQL
jgi:acyl-CoA thioesterase FadM